MRVHRTPEVEENTLPHVNLNSESPIERFSSPSFLAKVFCSFLRERISAKENDDVQYFRAWKILDYLSNDVNCHVLEFILHFSYRVHFLSKIRSWSRSEEQEIRTILFLILSKDKSE